MEQTPKEVERLTSFTPEQQADLKAYIKGIVQSWTSPTGITSEVTSLAEQIAERWGMEREDMYLQALTLLRIALEAQDAGNQLVVVDDNNKIVEDLIEIGPEKSASSAQPAGA